LLRFKHRISLQAFFYEPLNFLILRDFHKDILHAPNAMQNL